MLSSSRPTRPRPPSRPFVPRLEALESRLTPSVTTRATGQMLSAVAGASQDVVRVVESGKRIDVLGGTRGQVAGAVNARKPALIEIGLPARGGPAHIDYFLRGSQQAAGQPAAARTIMVMLGTHSPVSQLVLARRIHIAPGNDIRVFVFQAPGSRAAILSFHGTSLPLQEQFVVVPALTVVNPLFPVISFRPLFSPGVPPGAFSPVFLPSGAFSPVFVPAGAFSPTFLPAGAFSPDLLASGAFSPALLPSGAFSPVLLPSGAFLPAFVPVGAFSVLGPASFGFFFA